MTATLDPDAKVAVVVPFYQKKRGVLRGAIEAALLQKQVPDFPIIVADDESPVPAREELAELSAQYPGRIRIVEQPNSGPGAARNRALDHVPEGTRYVAFLDSDDHWMENHLYRALFALEKGYDFYFSDFFFPDYKNESAFNRAKRIGLEEHKPVAGSECLYAYQGDMFNQVLTGNVIGTSTVVYRYGKFPELRFREEFFNGQDYVFWLDFSRLSDKIVFSSLAECDYGLGLNIYSSSGWGTEKSLSRLHNEIKLWRSVARSYRLSREQEAFNDVRLRRLRLGFVQDVLHRVRHRKAVDPKSIVSLIKIDPWVLVTFFPAAMKVALGKFWPPRG